MSFAKRIVNKQGRLYGLTWKQRDTETPLSADQQKQVSAILEADERKRLGWAERDAQAAREGSQTFERPEAGGPA